MKIYLAGSLFKEADITQRKFEAKALREKGFDVYNPIEAPCNNKVSLPTPLDIFKKDYNELYTSDIMVVCLDDIISGNDMGVACELGLAYELGIKIIGVCSDIRMKTSNKYDVTPVGINHFALGLIHSAKADIFLSFDELISKIGEIKLEREI